MWFICSIGNGRLKMKVEVNEETIKLLEKEMNEQLKAGAKDIWGTYADLPLSYGKGIGIRFALEMLGIKVESIIPYQKSRRVGE